MIPGKDALCRLQQGVTAWNAFRSQNRDSVMLNGTCLAHACLADADLNRVFFMESNLEGATLTGANLAGAILRKADLRRSDLRQASLHGADLCRANLEGADLREACLSAAFLRRADLRGADLSTATGLTGAQLCDAIGDARTELPAGVARPADWL